MVILRHIYVSFPEKGFSIPEFQDFSKTRRIDPPQKCREAGCLREKDRR
jgi:hypothetical protein